MATNTQPVSITIDQFSRLLQLLNNTHLQTTNPPEWIFLKGLLDALLQLNKNLVVALNDLTPVIPPAKTPNPAPIHLGYDSSIELMIPIQGPAGINGKDAQSIPGMDGNDGSDGFPIPGPQGVQGISGSLGFPGFDGNDGNDSVIPGPQGISGTSGIPGFPGMDGTDGIDSVIPGPIGCKGDTGLIGPPGMDGNDGNDIIQYASPLINPYSGIARHVLFGNGAVKTPLMPNLFPGNPTGTTSTTGVMMGLGGTVVFTPTQGGRCLAFFSFNASNTILASGVTATVYTGTGTAPANGDAVTGSQASGSKSFTVPVAGSNTELVIPFVFASLTVGVANWFDILLQANTSGTASISSVSFQGLEL